VKDFFKKVREDVAEHASVPFWSWNDQLNEKELVRQIRDMHSLGMKGFFMHARGGLETPYLSQEWFDAIRTCVNEAKTLGMEAWAYDENGWPSGFAGGILLEDESNHACGLVWEKSPSFPTDNEDILGIYLVSDIGVKRVFAPCGAKEYVAIKRKRDFSYVDTMNPKITKRYLSLIHERYKKEVGEEFGRTMPGFFTDEPQYFRYGTPWSDTFLSTFEKDFGYDVLDALPSLFFDFEGACEYRYDYYLHCHKSFYSGFMKVVYDWCNENGVKLTGHGIEEWTLSGQMRCCGGIMPFYLYEHVPGIDYLGRGVKDVSGAKQLGSVCEQTGKKLRLSETFAGCGWDVTPRELKRIAELQYCGGVNFICEHLYPYSERGQRKRDFPCHFSEHNPWHKYFGEFEEYFKNLGAILAQGRELANTLVIHPIRTAYLYYKRFDESSLKELEKKYSDVIAKLDNDKISYHFGDETVMSTLARVDGNTIRIGECVYDKVIIPCCETLDLRTVELLREYLDNGGKLCMLYDAPERVDGRKANLDFLVSNLSYDEIKDSQNVKIRHRCNEDSLHLQIRNFEGKKIIFISNTSEKRYRNVEITVDNCQGLVEIDVNALKSSALRGRKNPDGSVTVLYDFDDSESCVLVEDETEFLEFTHLIPQKTIELNNTFRLCEDFENMMTLDTASVSLNGGSFSDIRPVVRIKDNLLRERFFGSVTMRYYFFIEELPQCLSFACEPMNYTEVNVNGKHICFCKEWRIDRRFCVANISEEVCKGENYIELTFDYYQNERVYTVLYGGGNEALRNCLAFDTEIESIYLFGDFTVNSRSGFVETEGNTLYADGNFVLNKKRDLIDISNTVSNGYPFFAGTLKVQTELYYEKNDPTYLKLDGRFAVSEIKVNGITIPDNIFNNGYDLSDELREGKNILEISLCLSNRNLLGPHHTHDPEPKWIVPKTFSFESLWDNGCCPDYENGYFFVKHGIF